MRKPTDLENRIRVRAYYAWLSAPRPDLVQPVANWLAAEKIELALLAKRQSAARKGAETKRRRAA